MEKYRLVSASFTKLKGLSNVNLTFSDSLTAIMGVNGVGKTTVIHALACAFQPDANGHGEDHRFPFFFVPNTDALWNGSEFSLELENEDSHGNRNIVPRRRYSKNADRWSPRYNNRPKRNVYYIGIETCLPEIEKASQTNRIIYSSRTMNDRVSQKTIRSAAEILNKEYAQLLDNSYHNKHFSGVQLRSGMKYSSLSMGTGEQRILKILDRVYKAEAYSLILIDEIDLLLHVSALKRLIDKLHAVAVDRHIQIVFTTHSLEVLNMQDKVEIRFIDSVKKPDGTSINMVYCAPNDAIVRGLTGQSNHPLKIYVEDDYSAAIVKYVLKKFQACRKADLHTFGSAGNAFTLAAGKVLAGENVTNTAIVIDGDVYTAADDKMDQCQKALSGTEIGVEEKRNLAVSTIIQYNLPGGKSPEEFAFELLISSESDSEIAQIAREINAVGDRHHLISSICKQMQEPLETVVTDVIRIIEHTEEWLRYIEPIEQWIDARKDI